MSRNEYDRDFEPLTLVTPRERRVSRNRYSHARLSAVVVTPRERRVSRNLKLDPKNVELAGHASREACE